ncbi:cortactin-binding protein 2 [Lates japonicus]
MRSGCALTPADRYSTKMASEGASGEQPPPVQTLATAVLGSIDTVRQKPPYTCTCVFTRVAWRWSRRSERRNAVRILFRTGSRRATAVASGSLATMSGGKRGVLLGFLR